MQPAIDQILNSYQLRLSKKVELIRKGNDGYRGLFVVTAHQGLTVFKKVQHGYSKAKIIQLWLPQGTKFWTGLWEKGAAQNKCRASLAVVHPSQPKWTDGAVFSQRSTHFRYDHGKVIIPDGFYKGYSVCASGVHFFFSRHEAFNY